MTIQIIQYSQSSDWLRLICLCRSNRGISIKEDPWCFKKHFFYLPSVRYECYLTCKTSRNLKKAESNRSSFLPRETLLLKCLVSCCAFNSVTLWHHTTLPCHTYVMSSKNWLSIAESMNLKISTECVRWTQTVSQPVKGSLKYVWWIRGFHFF